MQFRENIRTRYRGAPAPAQTHHAAHTQQTSAQHQVAHRPKAKRLGFFFGRRWLLVLIVLLVAGLAALTYFYIDTKNELNAAKNPETAGKTETEQIVNQVNKFLQLPTDEAPTLATVNDISKLKNQQFFKNAQNGDKVLIYSKAGRALLYRPSSKKVIEYAPVNLGEQNQ